MHRMAEKNVANELLDISIAVRMGFGANVKEWKEYVRSLRPRWDEPVKQEPVTKEKIDAVRRLLNRGRK